MRNIIFAPGEYYHLANRGVNKQVLFHDVRDYARFLFLILYLQSPVSFEHIGRYVTKFVRHRVFDIDTSVEKEVISSREVMLHAFCVMPNHFHLLVSENCNGGISRYMQRIQNGYGKYFNTVYKRTGHVFQGPFRAVHMSDNDQFLYVSAYIHKNPYEIKSVKEQYKKYPWSSYADYAGDSRWGKLISTNQILSQFKSTSDYASYVGSSPAKTQFPDTECWTDFT